MQSSTSPHVIVGMSGGVDSSVSAWLLKQQGYRVTGLFMKNWEEDDDATYCAAQQDMQDAQVVCDKIGIPLEKINFAAEYWQYVFENFLQEYSAGRTPNPDILCNKYIKFAAFLDYAKQLGADFIATGHYVRRKEDILLRGADADKDQSYFLYALDQAQLRSALFPVGHLTKTEVRKLAQTADLPNFAKKDSTGICFIGERRFREFLQRYLQPTPGLMINDQGQTIGEHQGLMYYTIGQRQGLQIGGMKRAANAPWYVANKDVGSNRLTVVQGHDHPLLFAPALRVNSIHWINGAPLQFPFKAQAKIRYRQNDQACTIIKKNDHFEIHFAEPQRAISPGQSIVFYQGEVTLGGGIIEQAIMAL